MRIYTSPWLYAKGRDILATLEENYEKCPPPWPIPGYAPGDIWQRRRTFSGNFAVNCRNRIQFHGSQFWLLTNFIHFSRRSFLAWGKWKDAIFWSSSVSFPVEQPKAVHLLGILCIIYLVETWTSQIKKKNFFQQLLSYYMHQLRKHDMQSI